VKKSFTYAHKLLAEVHRMAKSQISPEVKVIKVKTQEILARLYKSREGSTGRKSGKKIDVQITKTDFDLIESALESLVSHESLFRTCENLEKQIAEINRKKKEAAKILSQGGRVDEKHRRALKALGMSVDHVRDNEKSKLKKSYLEMRKLVFERRERMGSSIADLEPGGWHKWTIPYPDVGLPINGILATAWNEACKEIYNPNQNIQTVQWYLVVFYADLLGTSPEAMRISLQRSKVDKLPHAGNIPQKRSFVP
jgi:hypothetical protein